MLTLATLMLTAHLVAHNEQAMYPHRLAFRMLDTRGNGELSVDALEEALESYNVNVYEDIDDLFEIVDVDGNGYISFMEFLSVTLPSSVCNDAANFREAFMFFDQNGDGFIDASDLAEALGYKTKEETKACHEAMQEISSAPHRLSFEQFAAILKSGNRGLPEVRQSSRLKNLLRNLTFREFGHNTGKQ